MRPKPTDPFRFTLRRRNFFARPGSGAEISRYLRARPFAAEDLILVEAVSCPALVVAGLEDAVVPAKTVFAIANHLQASREVMEFPVSHSDAPEMKLWAAFDDRWIELAVNGIPEGFGQAASRQEKEEPSSEAAPTRVSRNAG